MPNYKEMYHDLFNAMTDAINILQQAQIDVEEKYLDSTETDSIERMKFKVEKQES